MKKNAIRAAALVLILAAVFCGCGAKKLTDEEALLAVKNYCISLNPDLEEIGEDYPVYWEIESGDEAEVVILFRSYTGAECRYYIDRSTGDAYVTEFVPGITPEEQKTDETLNVRDYLAENR